MIFTSSDLCTKLFLKRVFVPQSRSRASCAIKTATISQLSQPSQLVNVFSQPVILLLTNKPFSIGFNVFIILNMYFLGLLLLRYILSIQNIHVTLSNSLKWVNFEAFL